MDKTKASYKGLRWFQIVEAEIVAIIQSLKKNSKWSSYRYQEFPVCLILLFFLLCIIRLKTVSYYAFLFSLYQDNLILREFQELRTILFSHGSQESETLDALTIIKPFIELLRSNDITGPIAIHALSSLQKLIECGLLGMT